ncbi:cholinesterase 2-like [Ostrinia nubilalis]|uniref:cholinesterase 2-like n=1 Tax=Ostrinia nubilalis TaxID=29057 RepID=UPI0030825A3E
MGGTKCVIPILLCLIFETYGLPRVDPLVDSKIGLIRGLTAPDGTYSMFLGIPFATVDPSNPFGPSTPHPGFEGTFDAYDDSAICPQREEFNQTLTGTLDCLHLNVYVPSTASSKNRLPVLVWIYGGGFSIGFAGRYVYGPKYLVKHEVILVTINYRLGPYGFMCLDNPKVPGNQGLKDQLLGLRWVKDNIEAFGGDSDKITIFGESAGAVSVGFHLIYTQEELFRNVILQSGTPLAPFAIAEPDYNAPLKLAQYLGFVATNSDDALEFLRTVDTDLILAATEATGIVNLPCVENKFDNVESLITDHPINVEIPNAKSVPILIGFNNREQLGTYAKAGPELFESDEFYKTIESHFTYDSEHLARVAENVRQFYIGDEDISASMKWEISDFSSDFFFNHPNYRFIQKYLENGGNNVYHYLFSYDGDRNFVKRRLNITDSGASHADEITYLFDFTPFNESPTSDDQLVIDRMTTLWTNFVKYSEPIPETSDLLPVQWPLVTKESLTCLNIDSELSIQKRPFHDRVAYWDLFYRLNKVFQKGYKED